MVVRKGPGQKAPDRGAPPARSSEKWIDHGPIGTATRGGRVDPSKRSFRPDRRPSADLVAELTAAASGRRAARLADRVVEARQALWAERFRDAVSLLTPIVREAPTSPTVRELYGLALYAEGRYRAAAEQLEAHRALTGSSDELHVLADCYRAQKRWDDVVATWEELRETSPSAATVSEGRIVMAGSLADRGRLREAIALLEAGPVRTRRPLDHHLRLWFALADLYERAGNVPRARALFTQVREVDGDFPSVAERLAGLS